MRHPLSSIVLGTALLLGLAAAACHNADPAGSRPNGPTTALQIACIERGVYKVTGEDLLHQGVDLKKIDLSRMALAHYDKSVPFYGEGLEDGSFDVSDALYFFSEGADQDTVTYINIEKDFAPRTQRFMLYLGASQFKPARFKPVTLSTPATADEARFGVHTVSGRAHYEKNPIFNFIDDANVGVLTRATSATQAAVPEPRRTDYIYWATLTYPKTNETESARDAEFELPLADLSHPVQLTTMLVAAPKGDNGGLEHRVGVKINDKAAGELHWTGNRPFEGHLTVPAGLCVKGGNRIEFRILEPASPPALPTEAEKNRMKLDLAMLDWFEVEFKQSTRVSMDYAELNVNDAEDQQAVKRFTINGFVLDAVKIFDLGAQEVILNRPFLQADSTWGVNLERKAQPTTLVALTDDRVRKPKEMKRVTLPGLFGQASDCELLILTNPAFTQELKPLVDWKQKRGLKTQLVEITDLFNEETGGYAGPEAMRAYIEHVYKSQPRPVLRYVLLVGDSRAVSKYRSFCPSYAYLQSGMHANENYFAAFDSPYGRPLVAVGRFSVQTPEQARNAVEKTINYESRKYAGPWESRFLTISAGDQWARDDASSLTTRYILPNYLSSHLQTDWENQDPRYNEQLGQELSDSLNAGSLVTTFFGHGGGTVWEVGPGHNWPGEYFRRILFNQERVAKLVNRERLPLVFAMTCYTNDFDNPTVPMTLGEAFINSAGGAIAVIGSPDRSSTGLNRELLMEFCGCARDHKGQRLGDYYRQMLLAFGDLAFGQYLLLGDPSLEFSFPEQDLKVTRPAPDIQVAKMIFDYELPAGVQTPCALDCMLVNAADQVLAQWSSTVSAPRGKVEYVVGYGKLMGKMRIVVYLKDDKQKPHVGGAAFEIRT